MKFSVVTWNIQGTKHFTHTRFDKIEPVLDQIPADILCLQEAQSIIMNPAHSGRFASVHAVLPANTIDHNVILSNLTVVSKGGIAFPFSWKKPAEKTVWITVQAGGKNVKIYNCHFAIIGIGPAERAQQLEIVIADANKHQGPVIICGDFNTTIPPAGLGRKIVQFFHREPNESIQIAGQIFLSDERYPFLKMAQREGFQEVTDITQATWCVSPLKCELFHLKLDWFLVRDLVASRVVLGDYISDHRSLLVECETI